MTASNPRQEPVEHMQGTIERDLFNMARGAVIVSDEPQSMTFKATDNETEIEYAITVTVFPGGKLQQYIHKFK